MVEIMGPPGISDSLSHLKEAAEFDDNHLGSLEHFPANMSSFFCDTFLSSSADFNMTLLPANYQEECSFASVEEIVRIVVPFIFSIIVIIGLLGNSLVVIVVLCDAQMRSTTNLLIFNLAVADLLFIVFCVPFTATDYALKYWPFGDIWCRVVQYLIYVSAYASIYTLVFMSLDRFLAVVHPIPSLSIRTEQNAYRAIFILWIAIILLCMPTLFVHRVHVDLESETSHLCHINPAENKIFAPVVFLSSYAIPLALAFILYVYMLKRLWHNDIRTGRSVRCKRKVTRMVVVVVVIFAICWGPIHIVLTLRSQGLFVPDSKFKLGTLIVSQVLAYINSCINPILYAFLSENFRKAFRKVIACGASSTFGNKERGSQRGEETNRLDEITTATCQTKRPELTNGCV